jgi:hypothetical protein
MELITGAAHCFVGVRHSDPVHENTRTNSTIKQEMNMAKRGSADKDSVNVSREIRELVEGNNAIRGPEVISLLKEKYPNYQFNENSVQVAYANARRKLGISRTVAKRPIGRGPIGRSQRPAAVAAAPVGTSAPSGEVTITMLVAARDLLRAAGGDAALAQQALKNLASLLN